MTKKKHNKIISKLNKWGIPYEKLSNNGIAIDVAKIPHNIKITDLIKTLK